MNKEILMVVDAVSNEKGVDKEIIFEALESALASATRKRHGEGIDVRVAINRKSGDYDTWRRWKVFADDSTELEVPERELRMEDAIDINPDVQPGEYVEQPMESVAFGRIGNMLSPVAAGFMLGAGIHASLVFYAMALPMVLSCIALIAFDRFTARVEIDD